jgi:hypothetical protein
MEARSVGLLIDCAQPVDGGQIHDPPDFILNGGEQEGTLR